jgi:secreted PhoX family phosphatase
MQDGIPGRFEDVLKDFPSRRQILIGMGAAGAASMLGWPRVFGQEGAAPARLLGFTPVPISKTDQVTLPEAYSWQKVIAWGDPISDGPAFTPDASNSTADQAVQAGMNHDGMHYFPLPKGSASSDRGLLAINFEYTDDGLLHPDGMATWTAEKVAKSKAAHGAGVVEIRWDGKAWVVVRPSKFARRITADTPIALSGPAAGHALLKTEADPEGRTVRGTINNCAGGATPWGTFLTCEENFIPYFVNRSGKIPPHQARAGVDEKGWGFRWHEFDPRFDAALHPNEPNRFGWVVEIDPYDPARRPVKRTALGRFSHEGATVTMAKDGRVVVYMGDDDNRVTFQHIYKFVSSKPCKPDGGAEANAAALDEGTLHAAKFNSDGTGEWLELTHGKDGLTAENGFDSQGAVLIDARSAAGRRGATLMDRPEWVAIHPKSNEVYCSLTNNSQRGAKDKPGPDAANPRVKNIYGHIIRWREAGGDPGSLKFEWDLFVLAGDPAHQEPDRRGTAKGNVAFACPDGLAFDARGALWIQTDSSTKSMPTPDWANIGNNQMLAADPATGEIFRFLTAPSGSEVTGITWTPDGKTMFINIQHPGEPAMDHPPRNDPAKPMAVSSWPDGPQGGRPRAATIAIRKRDGGMIGL